MSRPWAAGYVPPLLSIMFYSFACWLLCLFQRPYPTYQKNSMSTILNDRTAEHMLAIRCSGDRLAP